MASITLFDNMYIVRGGMVFGKKSPTKKLLEATIENAMLTISPHVPSLDNVLVLRLQQLYGGKVKLDQRPEFNDGVIY